MGTFAHALWAVVVGTSANRFLKTNLNVWALLWWGAFPDLLAIRVPLLQSFFHSLVPWATGSQVVGVLYGFSHSLVIFIAVFALISVVFRRPIWEMFGWLLHIFIDIPIHPNSFFSTPVLWPLLNWHVSFGFTPEQPWVFMVGYVFPLAILFYFWFTRHTTKLE